MPAVSRLTDQGIHIGSGQTGVISSVSSSSVDTGDGKPIALEGDLYTCSISGHNGPTPNILTPYPTQVDTTYENGKRVITIGATSRCGATIIQGFANAITLPPGPPLQLSSYSGTTTVDTPLVIPEAALTATGLDLDLLTITLQSVQSPVNGTVAMSPPGFVTFTPDLLYVGPASFTYTLGSVNGSLSPITANITVTP